MNCPHCGSDKFYMATPLEARCDNCGSRFRVYPIELREDNIERLMRATK